jgi:hypothetical protein
VKNKLSEEILEEQGKYISFLICFDRLLNDLKEASGLLKEYLLNDRLIEDIKKHRKDQEVLASGFQEKTNRLKFDIKLIKSKKIKGRIHDFKEQNDTIIMLLFDVIGVAGKLFSNGGDAEEKEKAMPLFEEIRLGLLTLNKVILEYNKKAQKSHFGKLITVNSAREEVKKSFDNYLEYLESNPF